MSAARDGRASHYRRRRVARPILGVGSVVVVVSLGFVAYHAFRAGTAGTQAEASLRRAEKAIGAAKLDQARADLASARRHFHAVRREIDALGPLGAVARNIPLVRVQVRGTEALADAGLLLTEGGTRLTKAAAGIVEPPDDHVPVSAALDQLRMVHSALQAGERTLGEAEARMARIRGYRLLGPLGSARRELSDRLPEIRDRASSAERGLAAMIAFAGGSGPRRYLLFSQNPDELRPTGGFIGTFGVLSAADGRLSLERYEPIETWLTAHPDVVVPPDQAGPPMRFDSHPHQTLGNVNTGPDWSQASKFALDIWARGGEQPVDGVISITPGFMAGVLGVVGPVEVPSYQETVTAQNVIARLDFHAHQETPKTGNRKEFIAVVAEVVLRRLLDAPASQWRDLGTTVSSGFQDRELLAWAKDAQVEDELVRRHWDGDLPATSGDFFYGAEFAYAAKNGRALRRTYDHQVVLRPDGSARVTTTITLADPQPPSSSNPDSLSYITVFGPLGATLDVAAGDPPDAPEPTVAGHPAAGWFRAAPPQGQVTLKVVWDVPSLVARQKNGSWFYGLVWFGAPDHTGDVVSLHVELPKNWKWRGKPPPGSLPLDRDIVSVWSYGP